MGSFTADDGSGILTTEDGGEAYVAEDAGAISESISIVATIFVPGDMDRNAL